MGNKQQLPFPEFPTLGYRLREAREQLGLAEVDIADNLRIDKLIIHRIENDLFEPEELTVFIRGYMRAYAKQVNLPVEEIDASLVKRGLLQPVVALEPAQFELNKKGMRRKNMHLTTISVTFILIAFVMIWTFWQRPDAVGNSLASNTVNNTSAKVVASSTSVIPAPIAAPAQTVVKKV